VASRALAVVSGLFRYWLKTGYLIANPAADLSAGCAARLAWTPARIMLARVIALCDAVVAGSRPCGSHPARLDTSLRDLVAVPLRWRAARGTGVVRLHRLTQARYRC
jgi:hypothetical protein